MPGFASEKLISNIKAQFQKLHQTFEKDLFAFQVSQEEILISKNPIQAQNPLYKRTLQGVNQQKSFKARIYFDNEQIREIFDTNSQVSLIAPLQKGEVKIVVNHEGNEVLKYAKRIIIGEESFFIKSDSSPHGMFEDQFFAYYLSRKQ